MSTITTLAPLSGATIGTKQWKTGVQLLSNVISFADALAAKGSALAADDIIEAIRYPAGSLILAAGLQVVTVDDATTLTVHVGITGVDVDGFVADFDHAAAAAGDWATSLFDTSEIHVIRTTADTIDLELQTLTGTLTTGSCRVWALIADLTGEKQPGLAQVRS